MGERIIMHIDMDAFFAAVELQRHPDYAGKPLVVGGRGNPQERGVVSTASYEARKYGIHSAMPLREAYRRCPQANFLPVDYQAYAEASEKVMAILREVSPVIEIIGIDEAFLDMTDTALGEPVEMARHIKARIKKELDLTASIGIAPNKLLAKIASDMQKPDGLTIINQEDISKVLENMPASRLWGIGPKTEARLKQLGIHTIGQLARTPVEQLIEVFGGAFGRAMKEHAEGIDHSPVEPHYEPKSFSREVTFQRDTRNLPFLRQVLYRLTKNIWQRLEEGGYQGKTVTVKIRYEDFLTITHAHTLPAYTDSFDEIWATARSLLGGFEWKKRVRLIGVRISSLVLKEAEKEFQHTE
jgi:DNA polymerase-4